MNSDIESTLDGPVSVNCLIHPVYTGFNIQRILSQKAVRQILANYQASSHAFTVNRPEWRTLAKPSQPRPGFDPDGYIFGMRNRTKGNDKWFPEPDGQWNQLNPDNRVYHIPELISQIFTFPIHVPLAGSLHHEVLNEKLHHPFTVYCRMTAIGTDLHLKAFLCFLESGDQLQ